jgi:LAO/AO transport system kinase
LSAQADLDALLERHGAGDGWGPLARAISLVESTPPWEMRVPDAADPAHIVGITGPPGAGKSTLTARLIESFSESGARVAVLAVDPSSPISGGAVLGDRVRMESAITGRPEVFVRSLASRGAHGAVAAATRNVGRLL